MLDSFEKCHIPLFYHINSLKTCHIYMSGIMRKTAFCICENKTQLSFAVAAKLISAFVFATRIVQTLYYLYLKFQASSHLLWLYIRVCVGPGQMSRRPGFSQRGSYNTIMSMLEEIRTGDLCGIQVKLNKHWE